MLTGQNGILNRAAEAKEKTNDSQIQENMKMEEYESILHLREKNVKIKDKIKNISSDLRNEIEDILDN